MANGNEQRANTSGQQPRTPQRRRPLTPWPALLFGVAAMLLPAPASAADILQGNAIECKITGGRGAISFGRSKHLGAAAGTQRFSRWVFAQDGVNLRDRIGLFWDPTVGPSKSLRVAVDGPVSKPTHLISATEDTLVAVAVTSDQHTTRAWLITINFPNETVIAVGMASGAVAVKAQVMALSCTFNTQPAAEVRKSAADSWRR